MAQSFDLHCRACPRLAAFLDDVRSSEPDYYALPVPSFGDPVAGLLIVGLAPGMHGANRTGRPFTGDYAGILLYQTLHKFGYANHAGSSDPKDGLVLTGCRITNAVKCLPPQNKPELSENQAMQPFSCSRTGEQTASINSRLGNYRPSGRTGSPRLARKGLFVPPWCAAQHFSCVTGFQGGDPAR